MFFESSVSVKNQVPIPTGIKVVAFATGIRWIGWGMCEGLIPVLVFSLVDNYTESSIISILGSIVFFLLFPFAGSLVDRVSIKLFLIIGLTLFFFDSIGLILAAVTGIVTFVVFANIFDGAAVVADLVGRNTYVRRYSPHGQVSSMLGFSDSWVNIGQLSGIALGALIVPYIPLWTMFIGLIPTTIITFWLFWRYLPQEYKKTPLRENRIAQDWYLDAFREIRAWNPRMWVVAILILVLNILFSLGTFFLPIYLYEQGRSLQDILLASAFPIIPLVFSALWGRVATGRETKTLILCLLAAGALVLVMGLVPGLILRLILTFVLMCLVIMGMLAADGLVTEDMTPAHYGRSGSLLEGVKALGLIVGPLAIGICTDIFGEPKAFAAVGIGTLLLLLLTVKGLLKKAGRLDTA